MKSWVKLPIERVLSLEFSLLSLEARDVWLRAWVIAGKCDVEGLLVLNGVALTEDALFNGKSDARRAKLAVGELVNHGLLSRQLDGSIEVVGWAEDQRSESARRQQRFREKSVTTNVTSNARSNGKSNGKHNAINWLEIWKSNVTSNAENNVTSYVIRNDREYNTPSPRDTNLPSVGRTLSEGDPAAVAAAWPHRVIETALSLRDKTVRSWSAPERFCAARLHCLLFANCTVSERSNRSNASKVAAGFAAMAKSADYGDITLAEYVVYGQRVSADREGVPWFDPWLVKAYVEFETA